jgi:hypothetical protein
VLLVFIEICLKRTGWEGKVREMAVALTTGLGYSRYDTQLEDEASVASKAIGIMDRELLGCKVLQTWTLFKSLGKYLGCTPLTAIFSFSKVCYTAQEIKP